MEFTSLRISFSCSPVLQALKESTVVTKFSDSALQLTPKKSTCVYRYSKDSTIGSSGSKLLSVQQPSDVGEWEEVQDPPFLEQAKTVNEVLFFNRLFSLVGGGWP